MLQVAYYSFHIFVISADDDGLQRKTANDFRSALKSVTMLRIAYAKF